MDTELKFDVGQANEFKLAMRRHGWTKADLKRFCEGDVMGRVLPVIRGQAEVVVKNHIIDTDASPLLPSGWKVEEHKQGGQFLFDPTKVKLFLSNRQKNDKVIGGHDLRQELKDKPVLNANVLDYLLAHPELIPEEWKGKAIFFWGTIYRYSAGNLCVRCLVWFGGRWCWDCRWLDFDWRGRDPAAVSASV